MEKELYLIGYASGLAANDSGCGDGPLALQRSDLLQQLATYLIKTQWLDMLMPDGHLIENKYLCVADLCQRLAIHTQQLTEKHQQFIVVGGDHSCAIGTWSGVAKACSIKGKIGLIWIDAHLDSHTPQSSETGNIHGMPVACLLGYGDARLTTIATKEIKLLPENVTIIGARSYEQGELALLKELGVRIFFQEELLQIGLSAALKEAQQRAMQGTVGYGFSIDLDAIDPQEAPGVGTPESNGISAQQLCECLKIYSSDTNILGAEIVEFNPHHDQNHVTQNIIMNIVFSLMVNSSSTPSHAGGEGDIRSFL